MYAINKNFFKSWSIPMAWVTGFLCADGNIYRHPSGRNSKLTFAVNVKDIDILHKIKFVMQAEQPIKYFTGRLAPNQKDLSKGGSSMARVEICSHEIYDDIVNLGIPPKKSLILKWIKNIPDDCLPHFIRGYYEGDGWITGINQKTLKLYIMGTLDFLTGLQDVALNVAEGNIRDARKTSSQKPIYWIIYNCNQAKKIIHWMYKDSTEDIRLNRKHEIYSVTNNINYKEFSSQYVGVSFASTRPDLKRRWRISVSWLDENNQYINKRLGYYLTEQEAMLAREEYIISNNIPAQRNSKGGT